MSRSRSYPDRTGSTDSHLFPAGIRHVPRGSRIPEPNYDLEPEVRPIRPWHREREERPSQRVHFGGRHHNVPPGSYDPEPEYESESDMPPARPWHRERDPPPQRVRFEDSTDDYGRPRHSPYAYGSAPRSPTSPAYIRTVPRSQYLHRSGAGQSTYNSVRQGSDDEYRRKRAYSGDEYEDYVPFSTQSRTKSPERFVKSEIYSDPESYGQPELDIRVEPAQSRRVRSRSPSENSTLSNGSETEQEDFGDGVFDFNPSGFARKVSHDASFSSEGGGNGGDKGGDDGATGNGSDGNGELRIYQSQYTGDGFPEGEHKARITAVIDRKKGRQPLFRWKHVVQTSMNFDDLLAEVGQIGGISEADRHGVVKLLSDVKKYSIKSTPTAKGSNVKTIEPGFLQTKLGQDSKSKGQAGSRTATWLCIPYFSLQKYTGTLSGATPGSYPTRTLLQEQYSGVPKERDLQQVVCQTGHVPADTCFYVAQLWCVVLDDSLLITCGTMTDSAIRGDVVDLVSEPSRDLSSFVSGNQAYIYVYYTEAVMYAIPLEECRSWFGFISHFHEYWPMTLRFTHRERLVGAEEWPAMVSLAKYSNSRVVLNVSIVSAPKQAKGVLNIEAKMRSKSDDEGAESDSVGEHKPGKGPTSYEDPEGSEIHEDAQQDKFHVFSWPDSLARPAEAHFQEQTESIRTSLLEMHDFLSKQANSSDQKAYQNCPEQTRHATLSYLQTYSRLVAGTKKGSDKRDLENRIDVFNAVEAISRFFVPLDFDGPTIGKFWGAIYRLVQVPKAPGRSRERNYVSTYRDTLRSLAQEIQAFNNIVSHAEQSERARTTIPLQLLRAWAHLVMALVRANTKICQYNMHMEHATKLIKQGMAEVVHSFSGDDLLSKEVVLPMEIVSLLSMKLLQDVTGVFPNLDTIYSEYLNALDNEVATRPPDRSLEHRINLLKQETAVIQKIVAKQRRIFSSITADSTPWAHHQSYERAARSTNVYEPYSGVSAKKRAFEDDAYGARAASQPYGGDHKRSMAAHEPYYDAAELSPNGGLRDMDSPQEYYRLSPTYPGGFRDLLAADCLSLIERRYAAFQELFPYAEYLQKCNENKYSDTKDRQEQAIYAFTIVTVIFLPLSAVAGIFGMNTSDIRNMELGQWVYWAAAVPITILVIVIGLWWMGELGNAVRWVSGRGTGVGYGYGGRYKRPVAEVGVAPVYVGPQVMEEAEVVHAYGTGARVEGRPPVVLRPTPSPYGWDRPEPIVRRRSEYVR